MSKWSELRRRAGEELTRRTEESYEQRDSYGKGKTFFREDIEVPIWNAKEGDHCIDILPYITGENNPNSRVKPGSIGYVLPLFVHRNVGALDASYVCPARNFGKPCPLCEEQKSLRDSGYEYDSPEVKKLEPQKVTLYNIVCYDNDKEEDKGVQVWPIAHWNMERHLSELAKATPRGGGFIAFADPTRGKSIIFRREGKSKEGTRYVGHRFVDRDYEIADEILDSTFCLEELLYIPTYDEIAEAYYATAKPSQDAAVEKPSATGDAGSRVSRRQRMSSEVQNPAERAEEDVPASVERSVRRRNLPVATPECPSGGAFGVDTDKLEDCQDCPIWEECAAEKDSRQTLRKGQRAAVTETSAAETSPARTVRRRRV